MKLYKLTEQDYTTYHGSMKWGEGITNKVKPCENPSTCSSDVIHAYTDLDLALLLNPSHADINNPRVFEASGKIVISDWDKCGVFELTTKKEIDFPKWYKSDKKNDVIIMFAILCAESVLHYFEEKFPEDKRPVAAIKSAKEYLKNKNSAAARAARVARADARVDAHAAYAARAARVAAYAAARAARVAAYAAARAARVARADAHAAHAARVARADAHAAYAAHSAADAAVYAAEATKINFSKIAKQAIKITMEDK